MYAYIKGTLEDKAADSVIIDNNGIGYKIYMAINSIGKLGELGSQVKVYTYYKVSEDNISLFGFYNQEELRMFELLISVSGVGAKSAIAILSNITPSKFALSVISNDVKELTKLPGIGAKSAQRIILELKDKLKKEESIAAENDVELQTVIKNDDVIHEAITALQVLGYPAKEASKAIEGIDTTGLAVEDIIKKALIYFSKN